MSGPWFGVKRYGLGLSPRWPFGWISLLIYVAAMGATGPVVHRLGAPVGVIWIVLGLLTIGMLILTFVKSDHQPWRWRWGGR